MGQAVRDSSEICPLPPGPLKEVPRRLRSRTIFIAVSLTFILATSGLVYYSIQPIVIMGGIPGPWEEPEVYTPHGRIEIVGDADFATTALLEGWPGDGTPENPYIIDGLEIDRGGTVGLGMLCLAISDTRVSFVISNCNLTRALEHSMSTYWGSGISLHNVSNGAIVNNTCSNNDRCGIILRDSDSNILINNYCYNNSASGIALLSSSSNTVFNNICTNNTYCGIGLESESNTVVNNTCNSNDIGIGLYGSRYNTISTNTCNHNRIGIELIDDLTDETHSNVVIDNTFVGNTEYDIVGEYRTEEDGVFLTVVFGLAGIIMLGAAWRILSRMREASKE